MGMRSCVAPASCRAGRFVSRRERCTHCWSGRSTRALWSTASPTWRAGASAATTRSHPMAEACWRLRRAGSPAHRGRWLPACAPRPERPRRDARASCPCRAARLPAGCACSEGRGDDRHAARRQRPVEGQVWTRACRPGRQRPASAGRTRRSTEHRPRDRGWMLLRRHRDLALITASLVGFTVEFHQTLTDSTQVWHLLLLGGCLSAALIGYDRIAAAGALAWIAIVITAPHRGSTVGPLVALEALPVVCFAVMLIMPRYQSRRVRRVAWLIPIAALGTVAGGVGPSTYLVLAP